MPYYCQACNSIGKDPHTGKILLEPATPVGIVQDGTRMRVRCKYGHVTDAPYVAASSPIQRETRTPTPQGKGSARGDFHKRP